MMTPEEIKTAAERQWQKPGVAAYDRPAGWATPHGAADLTGGYWVGGMCDLWRRLTLKRK
jgi:hypothetical protein